MDATTLPGDGSNEPVSVAQEQLHIEVWIVEDNLPYMDNLVRLVNDEPGLTCTGNFPSCELALSRLSDTFHPKVLLLDIGLPGMSGLDAIRKMKNIVPDLEIVILTVFEDEEKIMRAIAAGASGYLLKTATEPEILKAVKDVSRGGAPINPWVARKVLTAVTTPRSASLDFSLTSREADILKLVVGGLTKKQIARRLYLSIHTVDHHMRNIYYKLQVHNKSGAVAIALREHLF